MNEDLLSNEFTESINIVKIERNIKNILIMTTIGSIYCIIDIIKWLKTYYSASLSTFTTPNLKEKLLFYTSMSILMFILFFISWIYYLKGNMLLKKSFQIRDPTIFNNAYNMISKTTIISIVGNFINLISITISSFF